MICPKCNAKSSIVGSILNAGDNEVYRRRKCRECGHIFYSVEFEVDDNVAYRDYFNKADVKRREAKKQKRKEREQKKKEKLK